MSDLLAMQRAVWRSARTTTEKIVLLAIIDYYGESSQQPWPSVPTLSNRTSLGRTAVLEAITMAGSEEDTTLATPNPSEPVHEANPSATRTSPPGERNQSARRTPPVRQADPKEPRKEPNVHALRCCERAEANVVAK